MKDITDKLYFESMLSAIGVVKKEKEKILIRNTVKVWIPSSPTEECPY